MFNINRFRSLVALAATFFAVLLVGCGGSGAASGSHDEVKRVKQAFQGWVTAFNSRNLQGMRARYSPDYLQDGSTRDDDLTAAAFLFSMSDSLTVQFEDVDIPSVTVVNDNATIDVYFTLTTRQKDAQGNWQTDHESDQILDLRFRRENGQWLLYGNQQQGTNRASTPSTSWRPFKK